MANKVGSEKLDRWIADQLIESRPDPRSGSSDKIMCEYWYDHKYQSSTFVDNTNEHIDINQDEANNESALKEAMGQFCVDVGFL